MHPVHPCSWYRHGDTTAPGTLYPALATVPTLATDGISVPADLRDLFGKLLITHSAVAARSFTIVLWGYMPRSTILIAGVETAITPSAAWTNLGSISVNEAANSSECHQMQGLGGFTRVAAQVTTAVGAPTVWTDFGFSRHIRGE